MIHLSFRQRLTLFFAGRVFLYTKDRGRYGKQKWGAAKCKIHGLYVSYELGWKHELVCPDCEKIRLARHL